MNTICSLHQGNHPLKLGKNIVIHPFVSIQPLNGPIIIEDGCIIEEKSLLVNNHHDPMIIGANSYLQVGCTVIDSNIGHDCILQPKAFVQGMTIGDYNIIGAINSLYGPDKTKSNTLIVNGDMIEKGSETGSNLALHLETLHSTLGKCHESFKDYD